jgi:hypothetical protein
MSKRYADQLERDFYEARVRQVGITARFGRDLTCFSLLVPAAHGTCLQVLVHPGTPMHDDDNKLLACSDYHAYRSSQPICYRQDGGSASRGCRAHAKKQQQRQRLTDLEGAPGPASG